MTLFTRFTAHVDAALDALTAAGTLPADFPFPLVWRGPDELVQVEHDDEGLPYVVVYRIRRSTR